MKDKTQENQELELKKEKKKRKKKGINRITFKWIGKCLSL